jgi:hypothetical protein
MSAAGAWDSEEPRHPGPVLTRPDAELSDDDLEAVVGGLSRVWTQPLPPGVTPASDQDSGGS